MEDFTTNNENKEMATVTTKTNDDKELILKEGVLNAQDHLGEWVPCHVIVKKQCITLSFSSMNKNDNNTPTNDVINFSSAAKVLIEMLPDHARRSRESKLFPFAVRRQKEESADGDVAMTDNDDRCREEVILATSNGREMWEWASTIQWLGNPPAEEKIPLFREPAASYDHNEHYQNFQFLQSALLKMFSYKNLPKEPVSFEDIARIDRNERRHHLEYIYYPDDFYERESAASETQQYMDDEDSFSEEEYDEDSFGEEEYTFGGVIDSAATETKRNSEATDDAFENHEHVFGLFAYMVLVGTCVHVHEKCFELITSSNLYDVSTQVAWKGNSPFSMLCEGEYSTSRNYMVKTLFKLGYPSLKGASAGCNLSKSFSIFVSKPSNLWGVGCTTGQPVHLDDQKLCRLLQDKGDGEASNHYLTEKIINASTKQVTEFQYSERRATAFHIPEQIRDWGCTHLTKLMLAHTGIFELPDELYNFTSLEHLDLSSNCLFGLSHKLGNLINLQHLDIQCNLITELPDTIERIDHITEFKCHQNPITKPPSAVWSRGISSVRNFFKDMRESGTEINVDLRVLVLGLSEAGKTSLINGLIDPETTALTRIGDRTVGIEKRNWVMKRGEDEQPVNLLTYDFAGQEEYYITHHLFLGNRALYILAFDLSKYKDELLDSQILLWWDSIQDRVSNVTSNGSKTPKVLIVGTHADMVTDAQDLANRIHESLQKRYQMHKKGVEDRLKELGKKLDKLDPRRKRKSKDKDDLDKKQAAYNALPTNVKMEILGYENEIKKIQHQEQCKIALPAEIHAVSSKDFQNFDKLRNQVASSLQEVGPSGKYFPQLDEHLPASWFRVRKFIRDQSTRKGSGCLKLPQYFKLLSDELGINEDIGRRATQFCHELGDVLFFDKEGLVFLRPSFLIDVFKLVIRHDHKESTFWTDDMLDFGISEEQFNEGKRLLLEKGQLEEWLLDILWSGLDEDTGPELSIKNNLIQLLETFDVATPILNAGKQRLLIPEFQPESCSGEWSKHKDENEFEMQRWICVDNKLPRGLMKRLQVRMMKQMFKRSGMQSFDLAQNEFSIVDLDSTALFCKCEKGTDIGFPDSEGIRIYIRNTNKANVKSLFSKATRCLEETLREFPGLVFDHYAVYATNERSVCIALEELKAKLDSGETKISVPSQGIVDIDDLLPFSNNFNSIKQK